MAKSHYIPWPDEEKVGRPRTIWPAVIAGLTVLLLVTSCVVGVSRERAREAAAERIEG